MLALFHRTRRYIWPALALAVALAAGAIVRLDSALSAVASPTRVDVAQTFAPLASVVTPRQGGHWVGAWGAAPQSASSLNLSAHGFRDQTLREIAFVSAGGSSVRVRLTNAYGTRPLEIGRASVAVQRAGAQLRAASMRPLTFAGGPTVVIPPGSDVLSDPVALAVRPLAHLAVSLFLPRATGPATQHYQARQVNYVARGNHAMAAGAGGFGVRTNSWYLVDGIDVLAPVRDLGTVVALGDSITDGVGSPIGANARWPNDLARRLAALAGKTASVIDEGIGGNRLLNDTPCCGVDAVSRLEPDVFAQPNVRAVILLEGINDIGYSQSNKPSTEPHTNVSALQIVEGYEQIIALAHAAGIKVYGATLTPFFGARYWTPAGEAKREAINRWIRTSGAFDGVIDFAKAVQDPNDPERLNPTYDSGDHLHPNAAGYRAMANAINVGMLLG